MWQNKTPAAAYRLLKIKTSTIYLPASTCLQSNGTAFPSPNPKKKKKKGYI